MMIAFRGANETERCRAPYVAQYLASFDLWRSQLISDGMTMQPCPERGHLTGTTARQRIDKISSVSKAHRGKGHDVTNTVVILPESFRTSSMNGRSVRKPDHGI